MYLQAIWYTENQGLEGPVFGSADMWNGVGIFFDSFDNDGKVYLFSGLLPILIYLLTKLGCEQYSLFNTFVSLIVEDSPNCILSAMISLYIAGNL